MEDSFEKTVDLKAPVSRVWKAVTDHEQFGEWFRVKIEEPFVVGELSHGRITYPGYEHLEWKVRVRTMESERLFAFSWCPYDDGPDPGKEEEQQTLVEFRLEPIEEGTRLTITESGYAALPDDQRRIDAMRSISEGWTVQADNIAAYVE